MLYPPEPLLKYPHLRQYEAELMSSYIQLYKHEYKAFEYDVTVGTPPEPPAEMPEELKRDWLYLASLKIDAIGHTENEIHIIELKQISHPADIAQIIMYVDLYKQQYKPKKPARGILVTRYARPDTQLLAKQYNIEIRIVP